MEQLTGPLHGAADPRLEQIVTRLGRYLRLDPDLSFQVAAYVDGRPVLDAWGGPHLREDSLMVPYSTSKNTIGVTIGLLVERGLLDLDAPVAEYWPEFGAAGKARVTVRQLLSHQAGLPEANPKLSWEEVLDHHAGAQRLAATTPLWFPGSAFGYHGITIGNLADELVYLVTGETLHEVYECEVRAPLGAEFHLGLPAGMEERRAPTLPMIPPLAEYPEPEYQPLRPLIFGPRPGGQLDAANDERSWRFGHPAISSTASARGIARVLAGAVTGVDDGGAMLSPATVAVIGQQQVRGWDEVLSKPDRAHAIIFQKPSEELAWGGARSFGHDGAAGAVGCVDPDTGVAFGYTIARGPFPGGADPRAIRVARELGEVRW